MVYVRRWFKHNFILIIYEKKGYVRESVSKTGVEYIKGNEGSYPYLYPIRDLVQGSFLKGRSFYMCTNQGNFLKSFLAQGSFDRGSHMCTN
jgi:hypothetical protein